MTLIIFKTDYRGVLTDEWFYPAGSVADLAYGSQLVEAGRAELVASAPVVEPEPLPDDKGLDLLSLKDLRALAKADGIKSYSRMNRKALIERLS